MDTVWAGAPIQALNNVVLGAGAISGPNDLSASFRALYDDTNLYLLVDVTDDNLVHDSPLWYDDDSVALMIDGDYSRGASYDGANDFELGFRWDDLTIAAGTNSAPVPAGAEFEIVETDAGYRLEVKLPLAELGITPGYGRLFGLDVHVDDDDGGVRRCRDSLVGHGRQQSAVSVRSSGRAGLKAPRRCMCVQPPKERGCS